MRAPKRAPPAVATAIMAPPWPPQIEPEQPDAAAPPSATPPPAPIASPINVLRWRRALVLIDTRLTCCRSIDCGPLPGLTVSEVSVTLSNLPLTAFDPAMAIRTSVPEETASTLAQLVAGDWAAEVV